MMDMGCEIIHQARKASYHSSHYQGLINTGDVINDAYRSFQLSGRKILLKDVKQEIDFCF